MKQIFIFLFTLGFFISTNLIAQFRPLKEAFIKNRVLEVREYRIENNQKILSNIYSINDSGLVEKAIQLSLDSIMYDTSFTSTLTYNSQNKVIKEVSVYDWDNKSQRQITTTEYIDEHTRKELDSSTTAVKLYKGIERNNFYKEKSYKNGTLCQITRIREFKYKKVYRIRQKKISRSGLNPNRKIKYMSILDSQHRRVKEYATFTRYPFHKKHLYVIYTFNGDLIEKECVFYPDKNIRCHVYEYKTGIKLNEK